MSWEAELDKRIAKELPELQVVTDEPMSRHTSFRIGGPAKRMALPESAEQLVRLMALATECGAEPLLIGNGSNLLVPDEGLDRLVIKTAASMVRVAEGTGECTVAADAGATLASVANFAQKLGLTGLEFAHGIPGTVGGGVCMNAGAYDGEMKQVVQSVTVLFPGEGVQVLSNAEMDFRYRHSLLSDHPEAVVLQAVFQLQPGDPAAIRAKMEELMARRKASQPLEYPSAGSTFKRPEGYFAGTMIDQCGLKGTSVGGAEVSEKHAGFIINKGGATCEDVTLLIALVQQTVFDRFGVLLEPEVKILK